MPRSAADIRQIAILTAVLMLTFSLLAGVVAGWAAMALGQAWWPAICVAGNVTGGMAILFFTAGGFVYMAIQSNRTL